LKAIRRYASRTLKRLLPGSLVQAYVYRAERRLLADLQGQGRAGVFDFIYRNGVWGGKGEDDFYSGTGSREPTIIEPYVTAVGGFLHSMESRPVVVEVGCGDFFVGSRLVEYCERYIACDIVAPLIARNRQRYLDPRLSFQRVDAVDDILPSGGVLIIRQVLQHLSNADIARVVPKLAAYRYVIVTEHLPSNAGFVPNLDKPTGFDIRLHCESGVVLTEKPFGFVPSSSRLLCQVPEQVGVVRTVLYTM
jgi:hypothetical protein